MPKPRRSSGDIPRYGSYPSPSPEDIEVTRQLLEAGKLLDIDVLDHIIVGNPRFTSLKEQMRW